MAYFIGISAILLLFFGVAIEGVQLGANCTVTANCTTVAHSDCTEPAPKKCTCDDGYVAKSDNTKCLVKFNGTCANTTATECLPNAACTNSRCMCNMNFQPSANGIACSLQNVQLGGNCTDSTSCTVTNSECTGNSTKTCTCVAGYVAKSDDAKCLVKFNGTCANTTECLPNAACTNSRCMCNVNFQPSDNGMECNSYIQNIQLGGNCTDSASGCIVANCTCTRTSIKTCTCVASNLAKPDNATCSVKFNETCLNTTATESLPNANCTDTRCMYNLNFQPSADVMECNDILSTVLSNLRDAGVNCSNSSKSGATSMTVSVVLMMAAILVSLTQFTDSLERKVMSHERQIQ